MKLDTHELAWAAGFFDGEGCCYFRKQLRGQRRIVLVVGQNETKTLERFKAAVGGLGTIGGPYVYLRDGRQRNPNWKWSASSFEITQAVIAMLWKFLSPVKRAQAAKVLRAHGEHRLVRPALGIDRRTHSARKARAT